MHARAVSALQGNPRYSLGAAAPLRPATATAAAADVASRPQLNASALSFAARHAPPLPIANEDLRI